MVAEVFKTLLLLTLLLWLHMSSFISFAIWLSWSFETMLHFDYFIHNYDTYCEVMYQLDPCLTRV